MDRVSLRDQRVLVTGATGMLGSAVVERLRTEGAVVGAVSRTAVQLTGVTAFAWDLAKGPAPATVRAWHPAFVVHTAAATDVDRCQREPAWARAVNVDGTARIAELAAAAGARLLYVSTDSVFRGDRGWYTDADRPEPVNVYAASKLEGEGLAAGVPGSLSVRLNMIGAAPGRLTDWLLRTAAAGRPLRVFTDVVFNPVEITVLADMLADLLRSALTGVCHVGADEAISKAEYAERLIRYAGLAERTQLDRVMLADVDLAAPRPRNTSLRPSAAVSSLLPIPSLDAALRRLAEEFRRRELVAGVSSERSS